MDQSLTNLFAKYQNNLAFSSHPRITSVHDVGTMDETLLNLAVINQARENVLLLIQHGADVNKQGEMGFTPVQNACFNGNVAILEILLANGATSKMNWAIRRRILSLTSGMEKRKQKK